MDFRHGIASILDLHKTTWLDQMTGKEMHDAFDPDGKTPVELYGHDLKIKGYAPRNYASMHSSGDNTHLFDSTGSRFLGPEILGCDPGPDDTTDASMVEGCAAALTRMGISKGIIKEPTTTSTDKLSNAPAGPAVATGNAGPPISNTKVAIELDAIDAIIKRGLGNLGDQAGGRPAQALREIKSRIIDLRSVIK